MNPDAPVSEATGVVLAGGEGERFDGEHKPLAEVGGKHMVEHVVETLNEVFPTSPVVAVKNDRQRVMIEDCLDVDTRFVYDDPEFQGPVAGLVAAVESAYLGWLFVCGCDMPYVTENSIRWVWGKRARRSDAVVPVDDDGYLQTLHSLYRCKSIDRVVDALGTDDSLEDVLEVLPDTRTVGVDEGAKQAMRSIDTREELEEYLENVRA